MHFSGKADMLAVLLDQIIGEYRQEFVSMWEGRKPALKKIEEYVHHFFYLIRQPKFLAYIRYIRRLDVEEVRASMTSSMREKHRQFFDLLRGAILEGQKDGSIQEFDSPELMALTFMYAIRSFAREITEEHSVEEQTCLFPDFSQDRALELLKKMLISSITKNPSGH
jgi:AcrR family transcriptional regulator